MNAKSAAGTATVARRGPASALFTLAAIVTAVAALHFAREILLPLALASLVSFLLAPMSERLERWGVPRLPSVLSVVTVAFAVLGLLSWVVVSQLVDLSGNMEQYRENIIAKVRSVAHGSQAFNSVARTLEDVQEELAADDDKGAPAGGDAESGSTDDSPALAGSSNSGEGPPNPNEEAPWDPATASADVRPLPLEREAAFLVEAAGNPSASASAVAVKVVSLPPTPLAQVQGWLGPLVAPLTTAGMVVVLVLFMLLQREDQRNRLIRLFGVTNIHATTEALTDIVDRVSKYLRMQFLINAGYGVLVAAGLWVIGIPNAIMFGVMSFSLRFLPYIGPWISAALPVAVAMAISEGWTQPTLVVGMFVVLELIVNNVAEPLLYGSSIGISGLGVIISALFWTWLWGAIGLVLAMPLTVCLVVMARYVPSLRFITVMLGDQPTLSLEQRIYQRMLAFDEDEVREIATQFRESKSPAELYDQVLIPALRLAEEDRHAGVLSDEEEASVLDATRELVAELGIDQHATNPDAPPKARALCIPLRDEADKTAALMLGQLLAAEGIVPVVGAGESLTTELVDAVETADVDLVIVSILPPLPTRDSRLLCRRLRERYPLLPIIVGYWDTTSGTEMHHLLAAKGDGEIVASLAEAVERARAVAGRIPAEEGVHDLAATTDVAPEKRSA
jgi:predicted PurR-regulated permease PerM